MYSFRITTVFLAIFHFCTFCFCSPSSKTVFFGYSVEFSCSSAFAPSWLWFGPKQQRPKTLAYAGTQPHPNLKDDRFRFFRRNSEYVVEINDIKFSDAGKFVCDADSYQENALSVVRWDNMELIIDGISSHLIDETFVNWYTMRTI